MAEPRKRQRVRTMLGAQIIFNNRNSTIDCQVRNMTDDGAKIIIDSHMTFPQRFEFHVPQKGRSYQAKVIWRQDNETGVEFIPEVITAASTADGATGMAAKLKELESENAILRKRVIDLKAQLERYTESGI